MLKRVKIQGYKSLVDVEVQLQPLTVLFGPNASGKSNFLDALQLLARVVTSDNLKQAFDPPYRGKPIESFTFGPDGMPSIFAQERVQFSFDIDVMLSQTTIDDANKQALLLAVDETNVKRILPLEKYLRYHLEIEMLPQSAILRIADESLTLLDNTGAPKTDTPVLDRKLAQLDLASTHSIFAPFSLLSFFNLPTSSYWIAMRQELAGWAFFYLEPREHMRIPSSVREVRRIGTMGEDIAAYLNTLRRLDEVQFQAVVNALNMVIPSITDIHVNVDKFGEVELTLMEGQTPISSRVVSEGTLRVLGLLALSGAKEKPSLIGFEEPENGIHPRRLRLIASLLQTRARHDTQVIVTTHSPLLLDLVPHNSLYVCRKKNGRTTIEPFSGWELSNIDSVLDEDEEDLAVSERILRGDFDA